MERELNINEYVEFPSVLNITEDNNSATYASEDIVDAESDDILFGKIAIGKNGALVAGEFFPIENVALTVDANGTYEAPEHKGYSPVTVNVSNWELLATDEFNVNTSSTSASVIGSINVPVTNISENDFLLVHIRDKAGKRVGYFYGSDTIVSNVELTKSENPGQTTAVGCLIYVARNDGFHGYGILRSVYPSAWNVITGVLTISSRYYADGGTINGTYKVDVYKLTTPSNMVMFEEGE